MLGPGKHLHFSLISSRKVGSYTSGALFSATLEWKSSPRSNTLAYCNGMLLTAAKSVIVQAPVVSSSGRIKLDKNWRYNYPNSCWKYTILSCYQKPTHLRCSVNYALPCQDRYELLLSLFQMASWIDGLNRNSDAM